MNNELEAQIEFLKGEADALRLQLREATRLLQATRAELHAPPLEQQLIFSEAEAMVSVRILDEWQGEDPAKHWWTRVDDRGSTCVLEVEGRFSRYEVRKQGRDRAREVAAEACCERDPTLAQRAMLGRR